MNAAPEAAAALRPAAAAASKNPIPYILGGLGLAALENKYIGNELPPELKNINYGLGGITGYLMRSPDEHVRYLALGSLPFKQLGLFGIGAADKLRKQQQSLVDANLGVADINRQTAETQRSNAGSTKAMQALFLLPALAAGAGLGYLGYEKWRKNRNQNPRFKTVGERGRAPRSKIRIDIPTSSVPPEFFKSLSTPDESNRAHVRLMALMDPENRQQSLDESMAGMSDDERSKVATFLEKNAAPDNERVTIPRLLWDFGTEATGIPSAFRAAHDVGAGYGSFLNEDGKQTARYGLGALGNTALALASMRMGLAPATRWLVGGRRLAQHANKIGPLVAGGAGAIDRALGFKTLGASPKFFRFPWMAKWVNKWTEEYPETVAAMKDRHAYNPQAFAYEGPGSAAPIMRPSQANPGTMLSMEAGAGGESPVVNQLYKRFLTAPSKAPVTLPSHLLNLTRYGANRSLQGAYGLRRAMGRYPNASLLAGGIPLAMLGTEKDRGLEESAHRSLAGTLPNWAANRGSYGMPLTGSVNKIFQTLGIPDVSSPLRDQLTTPTDY